MSENSGAVPAGKVPGGVSLDDLTADVKPSTDPGLVMDAELPEDPHAGAGSAADRQAPKEEEQTESG